MGEENGKDSVNHYRLDNGTESLIIDDLGLLRETATHPTCFVVVKRDIGFEFMPVDPLVGHDNCTERPGHEIPCAVCLKSIELVKHGRTLIFVPKITTIGFWNGREKRHAG